MAGPPVPIARSLAPGAVPLGKLQNPGNFKKVGDIPSPPYYYGLKDRGTKTSTKMPVQIELHEEDYDECLLCYVLLGGNPSMSESMGGLSKIKQAQPRQSRGFERRSLQKLHLQRAGNGHQLLFQHRKPLLERFQIR